MSPSSDRDIGLPNTPSDREMFQINLLKTLLRSYFEIVRKNVQDITVKVIWCGSLSRLSHTVTPNAAGVTWWKRPKTTCTAS